MDCISSSSSMRSADSGVGDLHPFLKTLSKIQGLGCDWNQFLGLRELVFLCSQFPTKCSHERSSTKQLCEILQMYSRTRSLCKCTLVSKSSAIVTLTGVACINHAPLAWVVFLAILQFESTRALCIFDKVFASFFHLTRKNLHKNKMHIN